MKLSEVPEGQMVRFPYGNLDGRVTDVGGVRVILGNEGFVFEPSDPDRDVQLLSDTSDSQTGSQTYTVEDFGPIKLLAVGDEIEIDTLGHLRLESIQVRPVTHLNADFAWVEAAYVFVDATAAGAPRVMIDSGDFLGYWQRGDVRRIPKAANLDEPIL